MRPFRNGTMSAYTTSPMKCRTSKALAETYKKLRKDGLTVYPVDHRISWALYFNDPDGNGIEVYWDTRDTEHGVYIWEGIDRPLTENLFN